MSPRPLSRRQLLMFLGVSAAGAALAACAAPAPTATPAPAPKPAAPVAPAAPPAAPAPTATTAPAPTKPAPAAPATAAPTATTAPAPTKPAAAAPPMGVGLIKGKFEGESAVLDGAGATFPAALYSKWFDEYFKLTGVKVNYQSIGSGGGIKGISDQTVDFGATDGPMTEEQMKAAKGGEIFHIPMALGAVVPTYNIPELKTPMKLTSDTLAGIFLGEITKWNDAKLVADNPDLAAVNKDITTVHRSDGSGTTYIFVDYLSAVSKTWKDKVGVATSVNWPNGLGAKGNEGVAGEVKNNVYSIGYVEYIYAAKNKLGFAWMKNQSGAFIEPKLETVSAAAAGAAATIAPDLRASIVNAPGATAYPIAGFTWLLAYRNVKDLPKAQALTRLMWWSIYDGQKFTGDLGYAPIPDPIVEKAADKILSINVNDKRAFPHT